MVAALTAAQLPLELLVVVNPASLLFNPLKIILQIAIDLGAKWGRMLHVMSHVRVSDENDASLKQLREESELLKNMSSAKLANLVFAKGVVALRKQLNINTTKNEKKPRSKN